MTIKLQTTLPKLLYSLSTNLIVTYIIISCLNTPRSICTHKKKACLQVNDVSKFFRSIMTIVNLTIAWNFIACKSYRIFIIFKHFTIDLLYIFRFFVLQLWKMISTTQISILYMNQYEPTIDRMNNLHSSLLCIKVDKFYFFVFMCFFFIDTNNNNNILSPKDIYVLV